MNITCSIYFNNGHSYLLEISLYMTSTGDIPVGGGACKILFCTMHFGRTRMRVDAQGYLYIILLL